MLRRRLCSNIIRSKLFINGINSNVIRSNHSFNFINKLAKANLIKNTNKSYLIIQRFYSSNKNDNNDDASINDNATDDDNDNDNDDDSGISPDMMDEILEASGAVVPKKKDIMKITQVYVLPVTERPAMPGIIYPIEIQDRSLVKALQTLREKKLPYVGVFLRHSPHEEDVEHEPDEIINKSEESASGFTVKDNTEQMPRPQSSAINSADEIHEIGHHRVRIVDTLQTEPLLVVKVEHIEDQALTKMKASEANTLKAYTQEIIKTLRSIVQRSPLLKDYILGLLRSADYNNPGYIGDMSAGLTTSADSQDLQEIIDTIDLNERLFKVLVVLKKELEHVKLQQEISKNVQEKVAANQKKFVLNEQLKYIKKELGLTKDEKEEIQKKYRERLVNKVVPKQIQKVIDEEFDKMSTLEPQSPEFSVSRNYLDWLTILPWGVYTKDVFNLDDAEKQLNKDHYGLQDVKSRVLEFIAVGNLLGHTSHGKIICLTGPPGVGKCLARDTPIIMYDGTIKNVQDIKVGELLMGDDSTPRSVLSLARGRERMYKIHQMKGDNYSVNESHILSLKVTKMANQDTCLYIDGKSYKKGDIVDINVKDYIKLPSYEKACLQGFKVDVKFQTKDVPFDPYIVGLWLGDANSSISKVNNQDVNVLHYLRQALPKQHIQDDKEDVNPFSNVLKKLNLVNNKHIPSIYYCNSRQVRLKMLAGLIDSDGHYNGDRYEIVQENTVLANDIVKLCRSLGFDVSTTICKKHTEYGGIKREHEYQRIIVSGAGLEEIPLLVRCKKAIARPQIQNALHTDIIVEPLSEDEYYGFTIDGNHRFLLGDFTVTHNTSIGRSIATTLNRKFFRFSVGGMHDVAEIKGHRRTYIGAMPGKFVQALKNTESSNPVVLIDEIDKIGSHSFHGDPSSALLEALDPEQNNAFMDHYLDAPIDLSNVLFICTGNVENTIPGPLADRMEFIRIAGYVAHEKVHIAKQYLEPLARKGTGVNEEQGVISSSAVESLVRSYCREAGVRNLQKHIEKVYRKIAYKLVKEKPEKIVEVTDENLNEFVGKPVFTSDRLHDRTPPGVVMGMAWSQMGGSTLYIESVVAEDVEKGSGGMQVTGQLGEVMTESSSIALTVAKMELKKRNLDVDFFSKHKIHLHVPEGSTPKDGPSAGIAMVTSLLSLAMNKSVRNNLAMTGEVTLTACVLPIGGVREKVVAATRSGIRHIILPVENAHDWDELSEEVTADLTVHFVTKYEDVFKVAFEYDENVE